MEVKAQRQGRKRSMSSPGSYCLDLLTAMYCKGHKEKMAEVPVGKTLVKKIEQERCPTGPEKLRVTNMVPFRPM